MVNTCCVPGCKSGYRSASSDNDKAALFRFPKDEELFKKWIKAIPRKDWIPTKASHVCEKHFYQDDLTMISSDSHTSRKNSRQTQSLKSLRCKPGAIPQLFPDLPAYLSSKPSATRSNNSTSASRIEKENSRIELMNEEFLEQQVCYFSIVY